VLQTVPTGTGLPFSPEWTANGGVEYDIALGGGGVLTPRLQVSYAAEQWASVFHNAATQVPDHTLLDARLTYDPGKTWKAEIFANNLTDETYIASQVQDASSTNGGIIYGARRLIGARFVVKLN
jgi:iron complex outermembrane receptor protein